MSNKNQAYPSHFVDWQVCTLYHLIQFLFLWSKSFVLSIEADSISGANRFSPSKERPIGSIINVGVRKIEPTKKYKK